MADSEELLTGSEPLERNLGYTPMPEPTPSETADEPLRDDLVRHIDRPNQPEPVERVYQDADGSGRRRDEHETVPVERASDDLAAIREQEKAELEKQHNAELTEALNYLKAQVEAPAGPQQAQPAEAQQQQPEIEQPQPELDPEQAQQQIAEADREIEAFLANPAVRSRVEYELGQVQQQAAAQVQQAKQTYEAGLAQNAATALAVLTAEFPEYAGMSGAQLEGALKVSNPQRAEAFRQRVGQVNTVVGAIQREVAQHQQQQQALQAQQYERAQDTFRQYAAEQDARVMANDPPETVAAIRHAFVAEAKAAEISEKELATVNNTNSAMRHSFVQNLLADGMRYRLAQRSVSRAVNRPVPQVQRPGISEPARSDDGQVAALWTKLNSNNQGLSGLRNAAELVTARRRARS
jgi:hypothetical protein